MVRKSRKIKGFTLVELLIVIVLLGVLSAVVIMRFAGATQESKEATLKANLQALRSALETYRARANSGMYPSDLDWLWDETSEDVKYAAFVKKIPPDPFLKNHGWNSAELDPLDTPLGRDDVITGAGGWAYDSVRGRLCVNYKSTATDIPAPLDTSWGEAYNVW